VTDTVKVYCQDEAHRRQGETGVVRRFEVDTFELIEGRWEAAAPVYSAKQRRISKGEVPRPSGPRQLGGDRTTRRWIGGRGEDSRLVFELDCMLCPKGRPVPLRDETLQVALTRLHGVGECQVSLLALAKVVEMEKRPARRGAPPGF